MLESAIGRRLALPGFAEPVTVESVDDWGEVVDEEEVVFVRVRTTRGEPKEDTVDKAVLLASLAAAEGSTTVGPVDATQQFLLVESARVRLSYAWDPHFAVSLSGIEALPHQLEAVYERMLPQARLRYLLADDPGSGKTIMAGLLLKELRLRGAVERTLILCPAPLTLQWQDELRSKFDEVFEVIDSHAVRGQLGGSPWARFSQCCASLDFAKQDHIAPELLRERWDLVILDEAHKASMPDPEKPTLRYKLMRDLVDRTERLLFLTATPHQGNPRQFHNLLRLLDEDAFRSDKAVEMFLKQEDSPWILRRMKEDLRDFEGRKLFVERHAYTEDFRLNEHEWALYQAVSEYINNFFPRGHGKQKASVALVRMVFQRRLASSLRAIRISVENRLKRQRDLLEELNALPAAQRDRRLRELANLPLDPELESDDETEEALDEVAQQAVVAERYEQFQLEVPALERLLVLCLETEKRGEESKLDKLFSCLKQSQFDELRERSGKLIIFTEQRATLDYLREKLEKEGYRCCEIHGGMDALSRKTAQTEFRREAQICIATDAAGEGINLQFCHLMINYDMPWNPTRLEQRMGRIHRFGQEREVHVFNFVALAGPRGEEEQPVVEGRVLFRLLQKLEKIKDAIGDRVFDVIGLLLRVNDLNLEDVLREATFNPRLLSDYEDEIERLSEERLAEYEQATGVALARRTVDLARIRGQDFASEERRLMPEYVEDYFVQAAAATRLRLAHRANPLLMRIEHVPQKFCVRSLLSVRTRGEPARSYPKASFHKQELMKPENVGDSELLSPGHPLYAAVDEVLGLSLRALAGGIGLWLDPYARDPYRLHFFELELEGESLGDPGEPPRSLPVHARLLAVQEIPGAGLSLAQPDILHDLTPVAADAGPSTGTWTEAPAPGDLRRVEGWVRARVQHRLVAEHRERRSSEVKIRREFLKRAFDASLQAARKRQWAHHARVLDGDKEYALARDEAQRLADDLEATHEHRLRGLDHMAVVRSGRVAHLATALVSPVPEDGEGGGGMHRDDEVELRAVDIATRYEEERGWTVEQVWKLMDGSGFDLRSVSPPDERGVIRVRRIEVKGRARDNVEVQLTPNEWRKAARLGDTYWLYVVWGCKTGRPRLKTIQNPHARLRAQAQKVVAFKGYRIPGNALAAAEGKEWIP